MSSSQLRNWPSSAGRKTTNTAAKTHRGSRGCRSLMREAFTRAGNDDWTSKATKTIVRWRLRSSQEMESGRKPACPRTLALHRDAVLAARRWSAPRVVTRPPAPREPEHDPDGDGAQSSEQTNDHERLTGLRIVGLPRAQGHNAEDRAEEPVGSDEGIGCGASADHHHVHRAESAVRPSDGDRREARREQPSLHADWRRRPDARGREEDRHLESLELDDVEVECFWHRRLRERWPGLDAHGD